VTTLVLLHGWGAQPHCWQRQMQELWGQEVNILTPAFPAWDPDWLADYLEALPLADTAVVGWSLGGMLLMEALSAANLKPAAVILVATPVVFCQKPDHPWGQPAAAVRAMRRGIQQNSRRVLQDFAQACLAPGETAWLSEVLPLFDPNQASSAFLASGLDYILTRDLRPLLPSLPAGIDLIHGSQDNIVPFRQALFLHQRLPNSRLQVLAGAGHLPFVTQAQTFHAILQRKISFARLRAPIQAGK
jgi:pimeloyl-[acyl-carrier protein] methyl ester esterase